MYENISVTGLVINYGEGGLQNGRGGGGASKFVSLQKGGGDVLAMLKGGGDTKVLR